MCANAMKRRVRHLNFVGAAQQDVTIVRNVKSRDGNNIRISVKLSNN